MPIYEYHCEGCKKTHEVIQRMSDKPLETCECGHALVKLMSLPGKPQFVGPGFYANDYPNPKKQRSEKP